MRLTRRDALAALAAAGVVGGGAAALSADDASGPLDGRSAGGPLGGETTGTLVAAAEVLYPGEVEGVESFVRRFVEGRAADRADHAAGMAGAVDYLDEYAEAWHDARFAALDRTARDETLRELGADAADPDPAGSDAERVRYYVVNELLFALYASPTGGKLVGIENPQGHPGGLESYRRGPEP